ncbi:hypothetical protein [Acinetobacter schindleri]|uniref:hypothetical protein n=1 Tax=Acinetobacter schindleri TaxID=108981 RepID=UPI00241EBB26|nr:hypothetical protein [Acinetobacter schindleri]
MSDFEKWFKTTEAYKMLEEQNYFKMDLFFFVGARNQYRHSGVQVAYLTWQHQQAIIDDLRSQLNNMEACYIEKKKECEAQQKRIDEALQEVKGLERFTGEDCIADFDVLQGAVSHACKRLEKTLRGAND